MKEVISQPKSSPLAIAVEIDGILTRVFFCREMRRGVLIAPYAALNYEENGESLPIHEEHFSVWPNSETKKVHVHHTYKLNSEKFWKIDHSTLVDNTLDDCGVAVLSKTIPKREFREFYENKKEYELITIPPYSTLNTTLILCYAAIVGEEKFPDLRCKGISLIQRVIGKVKVGLYYTYLNLPSDGWGKVAQMSTSFRRVNDDDPVHLIDPEKNKSAKLETQVLIQMGTVIQGYANSILHKMNELNTSREILNRVFDENILLNSIAPVSCLKNIGFEYMETMKGKFEVPESNNI